MYINISKKNLTIDEFPPELELKLPSFTKDDGIFDEEDRKRAK